MLTKYTELRLFLFDMFKVLLACWEVSIWYQPTLFCKRMTSELIQVLKC